MFCKPIAYWHKATTTFQGVQTVNIQEEVKKYLHTCQFQKKLNAKTIKAYSIDLKQFLTYLSTTKGQNLSKANIATYMQDLHKQYRPQTVKRKLASLRAFCNYLEFEEILEPSPIRKIKIKFQEPKVLPRTIPLKTIECILATAHLEIKFAQTPFGIFAALRDATMLELLFATGMRISELCSLAPKNIDLEHGTIKIMGKGSKERILQIGNQEVLAILRKYAKLDTFSPSQSGYFFINRQGGRMSEQSVRFMLRKLQKQAGISMHITPHMFRHSFATLLLEEDVGIRYIQQMLGHSSIQTTQIYTQVTTEKQKQILTTKHPRNKMTVES